MVTMMDCIRRSTPVVHKVLDCAMENTEGLKNVISDFNKIDEIFLIGSGSSHNAAECAKSFMEEVTGAQTFSFLPNQFAKKKVLNTNALYLFISQTGTSSLVKKQILKVKDHGCPTISITDDKESPIAKESDLNISIEVGGEEYGYRTVGFSATIVTLQMISLRIGLEKGRIDPDTFDAYLKDGHKAAEHIPQVIDDSLSWFDRNAEDLKTLRSLMFYGGGEYYGIAKEGALKLMETPRKYLSFGYEAEDGIHGPCYAFNEDDAILFIDDGKQDSEYAQSMVSFSKKELGRGYLVGPKILDEKDMKLIPASEHFRSIEFVAVIQVLAYQMALFNDVEVLPLSTRVPHASTKYFQTHNG